MSTYCVPRSGLVAAAVPRGACGHTVGWQQSGVLEKHRFWNQTVRIPIPCWLCAPEQLLKCPESQFSHLYTEENNNNISHPVVRI